MSNTKRFLIAPYNSGLQKDLKSWMIPEDAFALLQNAYVWRGRVRKRLGSSLLIGSDPVPSNPQLISRLRILIDTTDVNGDASGTVPGAIFKVGQMFSIGDEIFTVDTVGNPAAMNFTGSGTGIYSTTNGSYGFLNADPFTSIYFYPADPVMGFAILDTNIINFERYIGYDTQFAYEYQPTGGWERLDMGADTWTGTDSQFFYSAMYRGVAANDFWLFTTNNTPSSTGDGIRYFDGTTWIQLTQSYSSAPNTLILGCRLIVQFKGRLLFLNTLEEPGAATTQRFQNRARFSQIGDPTQTDAWYQAPDTYGKGGFIDAPTQEEIISAQILRDRLIVYFERSTWELVYTGNEILPFVWQNINIELGSESTFSLISFDKGILGIGDVGIHACNGVNVERIDNKIPDEIYDIQNVNAGIERVCGIRDYDAELAYWAIPDVNSDETVIYPNRLLVYNYKNDSWARWDDSITALGYININSITGCGLNQSRLLRVLAGNQEGYTFYMSRDCTRNAPSRQITAVTFAAPFINLTIINHNLTIDDFILIEKVQGTGEIPDLNDNIYQVSTVINANTIQILDPAVTTGLYRGAGTIATVSQLDLLTKQFNFFIEQGVNFAIDQVDMLVTRTELSEVTLRIFPSSGTLAVQSLVLETRPYDVVIYPYEQFQELLWHTIYPQAEGAFVQFEIQWDTDQMKDSDISLADFELHAMLIYAEPTAYRLQ